MTHAALSARAEMPFRLHGIFADFSALLLGLKIPAQFLKADPVAQRMDSAIHWINHNLAAADKCYQNFKLSSPVYSDLYNA